MNRFQTLLLTTVYMLFCAAMNAQDSAPEQKIRFGFLLGGNYSNVVYKELPTNAQIRNNVGTMIGIISDIPINTTLSFAPKAEITFNGGQIIVDQAPDNEFTQEVMPISADISAHVKIQKYHKRWSPYFFAGPSFRFAINKNTDDTNIFPSRNDLAMDLGVGLNRTLSKFDIAPALRYSYGIFNVNQNPALGNIQFHRLALTLSFLG